MIHLRTHGAQDGGCRYTVGLQLCTMCLYGERGVSRMIHNIIGIAVITFFGILSMLSVATVIAIIEEDG